MEGSRMEKSRSRTHSTIEDTEDARDPLPSKRRSTRHLSENSGEHPDSITIVPSFPVGSASQPLSRSQTTSSSSESAGTSILHSALASSSLPKPSTALHMDSAIFDGLFTMISNIHEIQMQSLSEMQVLREVLSAQLTSFATQLSSLQAGLSLVTGDLKIDIPESSHGSSTDTKKPIHFDFTRRSEETMTGRHGKKRILRPMPADPGISDKHLKALFSPTIVDRTHDFCRKYLRFALIGAGTGRSAMLGHGALYQRMHFPYLESQLQDLSLSDSSWTNLRFMSVEMIRDLRRCLTNFIRAQSENDFLSLRESLGAQMYQIGEYLNQDDFVHLFGTDNPSVTLGYFSNPTTCADWLRDLACLPEVKTMLISFFTQKVSKTSNSPRNQFFLYSILMTEEEFRIVSDVSASPSEQSYNLFFQMFLCMCSIVRLIFTHSKKSIEERRKPINLRLLHGTSMEAFRWNFHNSEIESLVPTVTRWMVSLFAPESEPSFTGGNSARETTVLYFPHIPVAAFFWAHFLPGLDAGDFDLVDSGDDPFSSSTDPFLPDPGISEEN